MTLTASVIIGLAIQCAPTVAPETVAAIIRTESGGNPIAINVNGARQPARPTSRAAAIATARHYVARGYSVDLGLGQINSRNMGWLGLTWDSVFDSCRNVAALGTVLTRNFEAARRGRHPQAALRIALSMYNSGSQTRGFRNGYVAKVVGNAGIGPSAIANGTDPQPAVAAIPAVIDNPASRPAVADVPPAWNVFARADHARRLTTTDPARKVTPWLD